MTNDEARDKAIDFLYDFLNSYIRLDSGKHNMAEHIYRTTIEIKKSDLLRNDYIFNKAVSSLTQVLIEGTKESLNERD